MTTYSESGELLSFTVINRDAGPLPDISKQLAQFNSLRDAGHAAINISEAQWGEPSFAKGRRAVPHPFKWLQGWYALAWPAPNGWLYMSATDLERLKTS